MQVIVYYEEGSTRVMVPNLNIGLTCEQIALKDVPSETEFWLMNSEELSVDDEGVVTADTSGPSNGTGQ